MENLEEMLKNFMARSEEQSKKVKEQLANLADRLDAMKKEKSHGSTEDIKSGGSSSRRRSSSGSGSGEDDQIGGKNLLHFNPRVELPVFDGSDGSNARMWVKKCSEYFSFCKIVDDQRVDLVSMYLQGKAEIWFWSYSLRRRVIDWDDFVHDICTRFNDDPKPKTVEEISGPSSLRTPNHVQEGDKTSPDSIIDDPKILPNESQGSTAPFVPLHCLPKCTVNLEDGKIFEESKELQDAHKLLEEMPKRTHIEKLDEFEENVVLRVSNGISGSEFTNHMIESKEEEEEEEELDTYGTTLSKDMGDVLGFLPSKTGRTSHMSKRTQPPVFYQFVHDEPTDEIIPLHTQTINKISSMALIEMKQIDEPYLWSTMKNAVVDAPFYLNHFQHQNTPDDCGIVGLGVVCIINRPIRGVVAYDSDKKATNTGEGNMVIFDPGGSTFKASLQQQKYLGPKVKCLGDTKIDKSHIYEVVIIGDSIITIFDPGGAKWRGWTTRQLLGIVSCSGARWQLATIHVWILNC